MPTETEEEALRAEWRQSLAELETAITTKVTRTVLQRTARGPGSGFSSSAAVVEPGHQRRTIFLGDEAKVRDFLSQPKSFRSSIAFEAKIERKAIVSGISPMQMYAVGIHGPAQPALRLDDLLLHIPGVSAGGAVSWTQETGFVAIRRPRGRDDFEATDLADVRKCHDAVPDDCDHREIIDSGAF